MSSVTDQKIHNNKMSNVPPPPPPLIPFPSSKSLLEDPAYFDIQPNNDAKSARFLQLFIDCKSLTSLDILSPADALVVLFFRDKDGMYVEIGRTDQIVNEVNPEFSQSILIDVNALTEKYEDHWKDRLLFAVVDVDQERPDITNEDVIGYAPKRYLQLGKLESVITENQKKYYRTVVGMKNPFGRQFKQTGKIHVYVEKTTRQRIDFRLRMKVRAELKNPNWITGIHPYIIVRRLLENSNNEEDSSDLGVYHKIYQSVAILNTETPFWEDFIVPISHWCNGNLDAELVFEVYDFRRKFIQVPFLSDQLLGAFKVTTRELAKGVMQSYPLRDVKMVDLQRGIYELSDQVQKTNKITIVSCYIAKPSQKKVETKEAFEKRMAVRISRANKKLKIPTALAE